MPSDNFQLGCYMTINRTRAGKPTIDHHGAHVVSADAIALLAGVNFGSVEKVMAALDAINRYSGTEMELLTDLEAVPLERVDLYSKSDAERAGNTKEFCKALVRTRQFSYLEDILKLEARFLD